MIKYGKVYVVPTIPYFSFFFKLLRIFTPKIFFITHMYLKQHFLVAPKTVSKVGLLDAS